MKTQINGKSIPGEGSVTGRYTASGILTYRKLRFLYVKTLRESHVCALEYTAEL